MIRGLERGWRAWTRCLALHLGCLAFWGACSMGAADPNLHPLGKPVPPGEVQFTLRGAASSGETFAVESVYRPYREWDVKKSRSLNLLRGWPGSGSRDLVRVQRTEFHSVRQQSTAAGSNLVFSVSLRDPEEGYGAYQLNEVRVVGSVVGTLGFERWFPGKPDLDAGFGFRCSDDALRGVLRPSGLAAAPLRGASPLWPGLRTVDLEFAPVDVPVVQLFEATAKHHWDGWRQTTPEFWPGGRTIVLRHTGGPTVWREHEYDVLASAEDGPGARPQPQPPRGVLPGVRVEVFWPEGESLVFPETRFEGDVEVVMAPASRFPARAAERLAQSVRLRPGLEFASISAGEWKELNEAIPEGEAPFSVEMASAEGSDGTVLKIGRRPGFTEAWVCVFGAAYDGGRRTVVTALKVTPERWTGPLPE